MTRKRMLWRVDVCRDNSYDTYRVLAPDDGAARDKAIKRDDSVNGNEDGDIIYCEIEMVSEIDIP